MFARSINFSLLLAAFACHISSASLLRSKRSPDTTMEIVVPDNSQNYDASGEELNKKNEEEYEYWQGEVEDANKDYQNSQDSNNLSDNCEKEKEYQEDQNEKYRTEGNEIYTKDRENAEDHQDSNNEHYGNNDNSKGKEAADDLNGESEEKYDRYEENGEKDMSKQQDKAENYDPQAESPSIGYYTD